MIWHEFFAKWAVVLSVLLALWLGFGDDVRHFASALFALAVSTLWLTRFHERRADDLERRVAYLESEMIAWLSGQRGKR